jgi:prepilin-type N-terminal cleavage/methylation domain-containing protein
MLRTSQKPFIPSLRGGFTLIELLIVVAIIAILAAIAVPNFLEAQTRAKVARVNNDLRAMATAIETYRVDHNSYPEGSDNPTRWASHYSDFLGSLSKGYYTFVSRTAGGQIAGIDFATLTTPIAYMSSVPEDPFAAQNGGRLTYQYRNAKETKNGYILTSFGPDADALAANGQGSNNTGNPLSTATDSGNPKRLGDVNERAVIHYIENTSPGTVAAVNTLFGSLPNALADLSYDPTNGTISEGDVVRLGR